MPRKRTDPPAIQSDLPKTKEVAREILAAEAHRRLGLTAQAIGMWARRPGAPVRVDGRKVWLRWPDFARWREQELAKQAVEEATAKLRAQIATMNGGQVMTAGERIQQANARLLEMDVAQRERESITVEEAAAATSKVFSELRARLLPFPRTWAPKLITAKTIIEMEKRLDAAIARTMEVLAEPTEWDSTEQEQEKAA